MLSTEQWVAVGFDLGELDELAHAVGDQLRKSVDSYNKVIRSIDTRLWPKGEELQRMAGSGKKLGELEQLDAVPIESAKLRLTMQQEEPGVVVQMRDWDEELLLTEWTREADGWRCQTRAEHQLVNLERANQPPFTDPLTWTIVPLAVIVGAASAGVLAF